MEGGGYLRLSSPLIRESHEPSVLRLEAHRLRLLSGSST